MEFNPSVSSGIPYQILKPVRGQGFDQCVIKVGGVYKTQLHGGPYTGVGTCELDGKTYCGKFEEGRFTFGTCTYSEKLSYHGDFLDDVPYGKGIMTLLFESNVSCVYRGYFESGSNVGPGELTYPNGTVYEGRFKRELESLPTPSGKGKLTYPKGETFVGEFEGGLPQNGQTLANGFISIGEFIYKSSLAFNNIPDSHFFLKTLAIRSGCYYEGVFHTKECKRTAEVVELTSDAISTLISVKWMKFS